jgi:hypothetical protein
VRLPDNQPQQPDDPDNPLANLPVIAPLADLPRRPVVSQPLYIRSALVGGDSSFNQPEFSDEYHRRQLGNLVLGSSPQQILPITQQQQQQLAAIVSRIGHSSAPTDGVVQPDVAGLLEVDGNCCHKVSADVVENEVAEDSVSRVAADVFEKEDIKTTKVSSHS